LWTFRSGDGGVRKMSVYGIETEDDCRKKIDELLEKTRRVGETMNRESVADLKADLKRYFDLRNYKKCPPQIAHSLELFTRLI
jgi:hypothetical protein